MSSNLKSKTISSLLWNTIDKVFAQISYAVTGIVLANLLSVEDFGLIGIILAFAAFANIFIDSGFSVALIQKKEITSKDYSTIFLFNLGVSISLYVLLFLAAPSIADFYGDTRLVALSRVLFFNIILLSLGLVQTSMLMRSMKMRQLTIANIISLTVSGALALFLAFSGYGVWALVIQTLSLSLCRSIVLWIGSRWRPEPVFCKASFRSIFAVGSHVLMSSFINTFFQNIYSLIIGTWYSLKELGYYTQADKWSKMGVMGMSQIIGFSLFPALSSIQQDEERMRRVFGKMNRMTSYLAFPLFIGLVVVAQPLFQLFFGSKWDASILLFQLLTAKGIFFIFTSLLNNYIMATGKTRLIFFLEITKDVLALIAILLTVNIGITALVIGQVVVGVIHYAITAWVTDRHTGYQVQSQLKDMFPYFSLSLLFAIPLLLIQVVIDNHALLLGAQFLIGAGLYILANALLHSQIQQDVFRLLRRSKA